MKFTFWLCYAAFMYHVLVCVATKDNGIANKHTTQEVNRAITELSEQANEEEIIRTYKIAYKNGYMDCVEKSNIPFENSHMEEYLKLSLNRIDSLK